MALRDDCASAVLVCLLQLGTHCMTQSPQIPAPLTLKSIVSSSFMPLQLSGTHTKWFNICWGPHTNVSLLLLDSLVSANAKHDFLTDCAEMELEKEEWLVLI